MPARSTTSPTTSATTPTAIFAELGFQLDESPEVELDEGDIEDLHQHLEKSEIELVEEIDPALNWDLDAFWRRPETRKGSYDVVFSTSVIEHVEDDELFVAQIADLLDILAKPERITQIIIDELESLRKEFADPRRSEIGRPAEDLQTADLRTWW